MGKRGNKKVVYFVGHYGGLLLCLIHKITMYKECEAHFIYVKTYSSETTNDFMEKLNNTEIERFGRVYTMDERIFWNHSTKEATLESVLSYYDNFFIQIGIDIESQNTNIYMQFDEFNSMGIYLGNKKVVGTVGVLTASIERLVPYVDMYRFNNISGREFYTQLQKENRTLDGDGSYVTKVIRTFTVTDDYIGKIRQEAIEKAYKYEYFDFIYALNSISVEEEESLLELFEYNEWKGEKDKVYNVLLMSSNFTAFEKNTTPEEFLYGNQLMIDYFMNQEDILIKPHPRADYGEELIKEAFPGVHYLPGYLPSEFLGSINLKVNFLLASGSAGGGYLAKAASQIINVGRNYWRHYNIINRLYSSLKIALYSSKSPIYYYGIPSEIIKVFSETYSDFGKLDENLVVTSFKNIPEDATIIVNSDNMLANQQNIWATTELERIISDKRFKITIFFLNQEKFENIEINNNLINFSINKVKLKTKVFGYDKKEKFCVYTAIADKWEKIKNYKLSYTLWNSAMTLYVGVENEIDNENINLDFTQQSIFQINKSLNKLNTKVNKIFELSNANIKLIDNFEEYLQELNFIKDQVLIIISVRDTPGYILNEQLAQKIKKALGLSITLYKKHWYSYGAIVNNGKVIYEKESSNSPVYFETDILGNNIVVKSAGLKQGNNSEIIINKAEYSRNLRGLNIAVFDMKSNVILDTVNFDTHVSGIPCYRNNLILRRLNL